MDLVLNYSLPPADEATLLSCLPACLQGVMVQLSVAECSVQSTVKVNSKKNHSTHTTAC